MGKSTNVISPKQITLVIIIILVRTEKLPTPRSRKTTAWPLDALELTYIFISKEK